MDKTEKNKNLMRKNILRKIKKQAKGITLIALVVTIIVLLILAGIALNLTIGENGIFSRANDTVVINENASVYEQLQMVIADYQMEDIQNKTSTNILDKLLSNGIINEDNTLNVDTLMGKTMKTGKGSIEDGDIYVLEQREKMASTSDLTSIGDLDYYLIYYNSDKIDKNLGIAFENNSNNNSNVKITISKTPETEKSGGVMLKVEKIEGINTTININDIDISKLNEEQKRNLIVNVDMKLFGFECLEDFLISDGKDEQEYWNEIENLDNYLLEGIEFLKEGEIETINSYIIVDPDEKKSNSYIATKNGNYTFKVIDILNEKTYTETVEVKNIDENMPFYFVKGNLGDVNLLDKNENETNFEEAYIIYNGEKIDVTDCILEDEKSIRTNKVAAKLQRLGKVENWNDLSGTTQTFELVKDGVSYFGDVLIIRFK